jgi:hypothetical protein
VAARRAAKPPLAESLARHLRGCRGAISNLRGTMNPDPFCGKQDGSRAGHPALSTGHIVACVRMWDVDPALP